MLLLCGMHSQHPPLTSRASINIGFGKGSSNTILQFDSSIIEIIPKSPLLGMHASTQCLIQQISAHKKSFIQDTTETTLDSGTLHRILQQAGERLYIIVENVQYCGGCLVLWGVQEGLSCQDVKFCCKVRFPLFFDSLDQQILHFSCFLNSLESY